MEWRHGGRGCDLLESRRFSFFRPRSRPGAVGLDEIL